MPLDGCRLQVGDGACLGFTVPWEDGELFPGVGREGCQQLLSGQSHARQARHVLWAPPRSRAMTSGFQLHGYPEPLQSGTGDAAMIGGRGRTEVRNAGRRRRSRGGGRTANRGVGATGPN